MVRQVFTVVRPVTVRLGGEVCFFFVDEGTGDMCFAEEEVREETAEGAAVVGVHRGKGELELELELDVMVMVVGRYGRVSRVVAWIGSIGRANEGFSTRFRERNDALWEHNGGVIAACRHVSRYRALY